MGGRGGSSHLAGHSGGGGTLQAASYNGVQQVAQRMGIRLDIVSFLSYRIDPIYISQTLQSVQLIYRNFPAMAGHVRYIDAEETRSSVYASAGGDGGLHLGLYGRWSSQQLKASWDRSLRTHFHPQGATSAHIFVHEMGHQMEAYLNKRDYGDAWDWGKSSSRIVIAAAKEVDSSITGLDDPKLYRLAADISGYAVYKNGVYGYPWAVWETLAEAVQDVGDNGASAKPLSTAIWNELKRRM